MPQGLFAAAGQKFPPSRCGKHWCQNPSFASLTSSLPFAALRAGSGPLPLMKPRAATGFDTNTSPPLIGQRITQKRLKTCESLPQDIMDVPLSRVRGQTVAGPEVKCRRSVFLASPATHIGLRSKRTSQVRRFLQTCGTSASDLRHFGAGPATSLAP